MESKRMGTNRLVIGGSSGEELQDVNAITAALRTSTNDSSSKNKPSALQGSLSFRVRPDTSCNGRGWEMFPKGFAEVAQQEIYKICGGDPGCMPDLYFLEKSSQMSESTQLELKKSPQSNSQADPPLVAFLDKLGLSKHLQSFTKEELDLETLKDLKEEELEKIGIPLGPRKKILKELQKPEDLTASKSAEESNPVSGFVAITDKVNLKISFQGWIPLRSEHEKMAKLTNEEMRERAKDIVTQVLDALMKVGWEKMDKRFVFTDVDLSHTMSSMRAIWKGRNGTGKTICRELEVTSLNLSFTVTSSRSVASLYLMKNLQVLYLDHCSSLKKTKKVFSLLMQKGVVPSLEVLSVVGTSEVFSPDWLTQVESKCPKLKTVYFTRAPGTKALGWSDAILMQTMRSPVLLPCGHIGDKDVIKSLGKCSYDRQPFHTPDALIDLNPHITRLDKSESGWTAQVVDNSRVKLDSKVLYHVLCGEFYNMLTIQKTYGYKGNSISPETIVSLLKQPCVGCWRPFNSKAELRICFLHGAEDSTLVQDFNNLTQVGEYTVGDTFPRYDPTWDEHLMDSNLDE